jgi:hypothetical protein
MLKNINFNNNGFFIAIGLIITGFIITNSMINIKEMERTVTVKGLSEREVKSDIAIFPLSFKEASNNLDFLFSQIRNQNEKLVNFLIKKGFTPDEITVSLPHITDKQAESYGNYSIKYRYLGTSKISIYTKNIDLVIKTLKELEEVSKIGIILNINQYGSPAEFTFTGLNNIKPEMVQEATNNAREVAEKFAKDSNSKLGKIKKARQGQFSISSRDSSNPHIKKVRVVSTIEYYLDD